MICGVGILNLSNTARYLLIVTTGIKAFNVFVGSFRLAYFSYTVNVYSVIFLLYFFFVISFLIRKWRYFTMEGL